MHCPFCGAEQPISPRCRICGAPLVTTARPVPPAVRRWERQSRAGRRAIGCLGTLVTAAVLLLALAALLSGRFLSSAVATPGITPLATTTATSRPSLAASAIAATPTATTAPGTDRVIITEAQLNQALAAHADQLKPAHDPRATIDSSGVTVHVVVFGLTASFHARPVAQDGTVALNDVSVRGPLGLAVDADTIAQTLALSVQQELTARNLRVDAVDCQPGQLIVMVSPAR